MIQCCSRFRGKKFALSDKNGLYDRYLEVGYCPICEKYIAVLTGRRFIDNQVVVDKRVKRKAVNLYKECMPDVIHNIHKIKFGTKSNAGFHYGENKIITKGDKNYIRVYRVDFNNSKDLIEEKVLNG